MAFLSRAERHDAEVFARIGYSNPFLPERLELERKVLGDRFRSGATVMQFPSDPQAHAVFRNFSLLLDKAKILADKMRPRVLAGSCLLDADQRLYRESILFVLYGKHFSIIDRPFTFARADRARKLGETWIQFEKEYQWYLSLPGLVLPEYFSPAHCFAIFFQIDRAFSHIFEFIFGSSMPIANLRAAIWESIFTHDMGRYVRGVYRSIGDITTLITGKSGTGKELVAQAIGLSRYQAFDPETKKFNGVGDGQLFAVNLSALSSTLIESELFGHSKGSFTGAVNHRKGWLEVCGQNGTVFLDEIGELDILIQVKLLRILQTRTFSRVGETTQRRFLGKFVAATNRDLVEEIQFGRFREDLYYRLCADTIRTPTLQEQLSDSPADLIELTRFIARRLLHELPDEADSLASEAVQWIEQRLGSKYAWPGNVRELEQSIRNVMIRKTDYNSRFNGQVRESVVTPTGSTRNTEHFVRAVLAGEMTLDELTEHYASMVYAQVGRYDLAARKLGVDWRTIKDKVNQSLISKFRE